VKRWRSLDGDQLMAEVIIGVVFTDGLEAAAA